jgi:hypothetical protein
MPGRLERQEGISGDPSIVDLAALSAELDRSLQRLSTGAKWQHYLRLPAEVNPNSNSQVDLGQMKLSLDRYDQISQNDEYRVVSEMPAFQSVHAKLREVVKSNSVATAPVFTNQPARPSDPQNEQKSILDKSTQSVLDRDKAEPNDQ